MVQGHCMKCKEAREMKNAVISTTARGGYIAKGTCTVCTTKMAAIMSKEKAEAAMKAGVKKAA